MKCLLIIFYIFNCITNSIAQDLYEIKHRFNWDNTNTSYTGFLLRNDNGSGFIRLNSYDLVNKRNAVFDLEIIQEEERKIFYPVTNDSFLFTRAILIRTILGKENRYLNSLAVWFKQNRSTGKYELYTGTVPVNDLPETDKNSIVHYRPLKQRHLITGYLQNFFTAAELRNNINSSAKIITARNDQKPVFHLITLTGENELCVDDVNSHILFWKNISRVLNINFRKISLSGKSFNKNDLTSAINKLSPKKNDILFFTYSGHGFSYRNDDEFKFPQLALWHGDAPSKAFLRENSINLEEIYDLLTSKNAGLTIVAGDCCNTFVEMKRWVERPTRPGVFPPISYTWNTRAVAKLILGTNKKILTAAAEKGEAAASHSWYGGFFTFSLLHSIDDVLKDYSSNDPQWDSILNKTAVLALEISNQHRCGQSACEQHMITK